MSKSRQEQIQQLQLDSLIEAMLEPIPGGPIFNEQMEAFKRKKRELEAKLKAEITLSTKQDK